MDQQKNLNNRAQKWRRELFDNQNFIEDPGWKMEDDHEFWTPLDYFSQSKSCQHKVMFVRCRQTKKKR
jgi:hypothetical protein